MNYQLVKMEGDFVNRPPAWNLIKRVKNRLQGKQYMPADPVGHPACLEVLEGSDAGPLKVVYKRDA